MKTLTELCLGLVVLVLVPSPNCGRHADDNQLARPPRPLEEIEDVGTRNPLGFSGDDYFNTNDTSCVIIEGGSLTLEPCHEYIEMPIPITFRETWESAVEVEGVVSPAEFVVIKDGGQHCNTTAECLSQIQTMKRRARSKGCDLRENFYVGGDGHVYEGRGWDLAPYWNLNGLRKTSITFQFLGSHERTPPSPEAMEAFETTLEIGVWQGKLSKTYRLTSFRQLMKDSSASEDLLSQNPSGSDRWRTGEDLSSVWEYTVPGRLRFVFRRQWNASRPTKELGVLSQPVDYVVISEGGERCFSRDECSSKMAAAQAESVEDYGDLLDNFYIGDGGEVYEGRGWNSAPHWYVKGFTNRFLSVSFIGSFVRELPSMEAINSLKLLVHTGVWLGKISPNFQMFSLSQVYNQSALLGNPLHEYLRKWSTWSEDIFINSTSAAIKLWPFVKRSEWNAMSPIGSLSNTSQPIKYVMIGDGGTRCFSLEQCSSRMHSEQNTHVTQYGDLLDNFYIGDDGIVYEGRGWDVLPFLHTPFFNRSLITVKFLGSFQSSLPSQPGWLAFVALIDAGKASGKISQDYKIYSFRHVYNDSSLLGDKINRIFENMTAWDGQLSLESEEQRASSGILPIYDVKRSAAPKNLSPLSLPVDYVVVGNTGERCFTGEYCTDGLRRRQIEDAKSFGDLSYNFYVGEDGSVYTGRGWNSTCQWHVTGVKANTLFVSFLGKFQNDLPSPYAMLAFNRLLKFGVGTRKIATDYKIVSVRQLFPNTTHSGDMLAKRIKSWSRWSEYEALSSDGTHIPFGPSAFISKAQWSARGVLQLDSDKLSHPIPHVVVLDADESCFNLEDCILRVQAEQRRVHPQYGDAMESFYIGEDGRIYEGRGWSQKTHWHSKVLLFDFITVAFFGKFQNQVPSSKALAAFEYWTKEGIMEGKLTTNYTVVSLRQLFPRSTVPGDTLNLHVKTMSNWLSDTSQATVTDNFEIFSTSVWGRSSAVRRSNKIIHPLKYVFVREGGSPCTSQSECITRMKTAEKDKDGITENFYIGGTGAVFEGVGWEYDTKWGFGGWKNSITVSFLGTFETQLPTAKAVVALETLCQYGIERGYVATDYKILFIPDNYNSKTWVGAKFKGLIKSWKRWVPTI